MLSCMLLVQLTISVKMNREKLMKMAGAVRTGGKGSMRSRELTLVESVVSSSALLYSILSNERRRLFTRQLTTDDKSLQSTIKRIGCERYPFNQVNIFMDDVVIQFINPRGEANMPDQNSDLSSSRSNRQAPGASAAGGTTAQEDDDEEVPNLVAGETF
ncbi:hypothetical protein ACE6H2_026042 [Prunus campanulata]